MISSRSSAPTNTSRAFAPGLRPCSRLVRRGTRKAVVEVNRPRALVATLCSVKLPEAEGFCTNARPSASTDIRAEAPKSMPLLGTPRLSLRARRSHSRHQGVNLKKNGSIDIRTGAPARLVSVFEAKLWFR